MRGKAGTFTPQIQPGMGFTILILKWFILYLHTHTRFYL